MDILYITKHSPNNDLELLYSLRSLKFTSVDRVFISGFKPRFVKNVIHIPCDDISYPAVNHWWKVTTAIKNSDISENFLLMYDDIFFLKETPISEFPSYHRGVLGDFATGTQLYQENLSRTKKWLLERKLPILDYSLHLPIIYNRDNFLKLEPIFKDKIPFAVRSLYGNMFVKDSPQRDDFKLRRITDKIPDVECFSSSDEVFPYRFLNEKFPNKGDFE